ncbi:MAG: class I SAM-dependent methyltransferase [Thermodesulfobacteriota bacterium]|jgi:SAM-dependent methyltransferase
MPITPDKKFTDRKDNSARPSWSENNGHVSEGHKLIFEITKDIPGWQMEGDSYKLFEMGYFAGDVILEIGTFGGRSAVVELLGALSGGKNPQFFGIETDIDGIRRTYHSLQQFNVSEYALLFHGTIQKFMENLNIQPTMCFMDGDHLYDGMKRDLESLSELLCPGVPILCHDYLNPENDTGEYGVRKATTEWEREGYAVFYGAFGCSAFFVTTDKCRGKHTSMSAEDFAQRRKTFLNEYGLDIASEQAGRVDVSPLPEVDFSRKRGYSDTLLSRIWKRIAKVSDVPDVRQSTKILMTDRYKAKGSKPRCLESFPIKDNFFYVSSPQKYARDETKYDDQYKVDTPGRRYGEGLINLLQQKDATFEGPALEIGCGTGLLSVGLVTKEAYPIVIITDPSPLFLSLALQKMMKAGIAPSKAHFAVLKAEEIDRLLRNEFSLIALRSVLHHVLDVDKFIHDAALSLRPGGVLTFQEPCSEGYILMGALAQFIPLALGQAGKELTDKHLTQIQGFIKTMLFYARRSIDKSAAEDKHLFRVDEIMKIGSSAGLAVEFLPNMTYEDYATPVKGKLRRPSFYAFFHDYLKYCMSFDTQLMELLDRYFRTYCKFVDTLSIEANGPYMHGVFLCKKRGTPL